MHSSMCVCKNREDLLTTIKKMEDAKVSADETLRTIPNEGALSALLPAHATNQSLCR